MSLPPRGPQPLSQALGDLIALRGIAQSGGDARLASAWKDVAGDAVGASTKVTGVKNGILQVAVMNAPLLGELVSYHKLALLDALHNRHADLQIKDIKFRLRGDLHKR